MEKLAECFAAVAAQDPDRLAVAFEDLDATGTVVGICGRVVLASGLDPAVIARDVVTGTGSWADVGSPSQVEAFLRAAAEDRVEMPGVDPADIQGIAVVIGGYLLQHHNVPAS